VLIIKVQEQQNEIVSYSVVAGDDGNLSFFDGVGGGPICNTKAEKSVCYTTKNKIIGLRVPNDTKDLSGFSWKVNNVQMACSSEISATACSTGDDNALFFPILGNVGESVDVTLNAVSKKTGGTVALTRHFVIVDPQVIINSDNTTSAWAKLLGYYKDLDGNKTPSYSAQVFETNPGQTVKFNAAIYSAWGQTPSFEWSIDGQIQDTTSKQLSFLVDKSIGESYNIGLILTNVNDAAQEKQINNLRKALYKNWGVSPEDSIESDYNTTNIQLNVVENSLQAAASANKTGIFASLITNLPEQIMFLLKILLTSFVIMFSMGLIFSFVPESVFEKTDRESL
jgi:hypothetical protein